MAVSLPLNVPEQPAFGREKFKHTIKPVVENIAYDDTYELNTQSGTQWDGFRHVSWIAWPWAPLRALTLLRWPTLPVKHSTTGYEIRYHDLKDRTDTRHRPKATISRGQTRT